MSAVLWILLHASGMLAFMNIFWNLLNLLPIYPLDGGQISRELFSAASPRNGFRIALVISLGFAALLAVHSVRPFIPSLPIGGMFSALLFGMMALENLMMLQQLRAQRRRPWEDEEDDAAWRR
jgi:Zn-dependent protease